jgi:hypothetical protein
MGLKWRELFCRATNRILPKIGQTGHSAVCPFFVIENTITKVMNLLCTEEKNIFALKFDS